MTTAGQATTKPWVVDFILLSALWGVSFLFMRICAPAFGPFVTAWLRVLIGGALLAPMMFARGLGPDFRKHWKGAFVVGLFNSAIPFACFAYALLTIPSGLSAILNATVPLMGALVAWVWFSERPSFWRTCGLVIGFIGVLMLAWDRTSFSHGGFDMASGVALGICLFATLSYGIAANYAKKFLAGIDPTVTAGGSLIGASLILFIPAMADLPTQLPDAYAWAALIASGLLCTGLAYILYFRLVENAGAPKALAVTFMVPIFAVFTGAVFLNEEVTAWMVFCGLVILVGVLLSTGVLPRQRRAV